MRGLELSCSPPTLKGEGVTLRPVTPDDYRILFQWHSELGGLHLWWADRQLLSFAEFVNDFRQRLGTGAHVIMMVELIGEDRQTPVGVIYTYKTDLNDRYTYLYMYLAPEYTAQGIGPEAGALFVDYLFSYFGFRKIYAEIFGHNQSSIKAALRNGFTEEGCLRDHRWFGDRYWDLHILSISRERFEQRHGKNIQRTTYSYAWRSTYLSVVPAAPERRRLRSKLAMPDAAAFTLRDSLDEPRSLKRRMRFDA